MDSAEFPTISLPPSTFHSRTPPLPHSPMPSLYLHIPFCQRKCPYCDFNTYAGLNRLFEPYTAALVREIELAGASRGRPAVKTIFLGGGTPTVLPARLLRDILDACHRAFDVQPDAEITSEANPGTVDVDRFAALREIGVNRLSMGVQSFDDAELQFLGRIHSADEVETAFNAARLAGFDNINLDVIYGLPGQSPETWRRTLRRALELGPEHFSLYSLVVEEGTPFAEWAEAGRIGYPDSDLAADLYELAEEVLDPAGYVQYEISNWARTVATMPGTRQEDARPAKDVSVAPLQTGVNPHFACRHNLTYWRNEAYLGFGPGAHSSEAGWRWANIKPVAEYIDRVGRYDPDSAASLLDPDRAAAVDGRTWGLAGFRRADRRPSGHRRDNDARIASGARGRGVRPLPPAARDIVVRSVWRRHPGFSRAWPARSPARPGAAYPSRRAW